MVKIWQNLLFVFLSFFFTSIFHPNAKDLSTKCTVTKVYEAKRPQLAGKKWPTEVVDWIKRRHHKAVPAAFALTDASFAPRQQIDIKIIWKRKVFIIMFDWSVTSLIRPGDCPGFERWFRGGVSLYCETLTTAGERERERKKRSSLRQRKTGYYKSK